MTESIYDIDVTTIDGEPLKMSAWRGRTLLIVNVASECGFTPQYVGLERLYQTHRGRGLAVLGFPCDQFGHQEPGTEQEIKEFCASNYDVTFPLFSKIKVNGDDAHPLFKYLKSQKKGILGTEAIKWNFTKFLVTPSGEVVKRYASSTPPEVIEPDIDGVLSGNR